MRRPVILRRARWSTARLAWLACLLRLLALLAAQLDVYCDASGCSAPVQVGAWLTLPLIVSWLAIAAVLAWRLAVAIRRRRREH